jgi:preprotein translocase subunit SecE
VARDRKRAKQRRARRGAPSSAPSEQRPASRAVAPAARPPDGSTDGLENGEAALSSGRIERGDLPGALEHAGDVDEFDAAIVAGARGVTAGPDAAAEAEQLSEGEIEAEAEAEGDLSEDELQELALGSGAGGANGADGVSPERASGAPIRKGNRAIGFLRASWAELQRVQWPDRRHVFQATAVVLGFVAVAGVYLGVADTVAKEIVEFIL